MSSINSEEIISILKEEIENFDMTAGVREVGNVIWVGDGIATVYGIDHAMYGEIVTFENGVKEWCRISKEMRSALLFFGRILVSVRVQKLPARKESRYSRRRRLYRKSRGCSGSAYRRKRRNPG